MSDIEINLVPPPPPPPILNTTITLSDSEEGEISSTPSPEIVVEASGSDRGMKKRSKQRNKNVDTDDDDIQLVGDNLFELDDNGDEEPIYNDVVPTIRIGCIGVDTPVAKQNSSFRGTCFNCGQAHNLADCKQQLNQRRIAANRKAFQGGMKKDTRIHDSQSTYTAGKLSSRALKALDLADDEYPHWIYRMREQGPSLGYPPGWLKRLMPKGEGLTFFTDDTRLSGKLEEKPFKFDESQVIFYEGFNVINERSDLEKSAQKYSRRTYDAFSKKTYPTFLERYVRLLHKIQLEKKEEDTNRLNRKLMAKVAKKVEKEMFEANEEEMRQFCKNIDIDANEDPKNFLRVMDENNIPISRKERKKLEKRIAKIEEQRLAEAQRLAEEQRLAELAKQRALEARAKKQASTKKTASNSVPVQAANVAVTPPVSRTRTIHTQTIPVIITEYPQLPPEHKQQAHKQQRVQALMNIKSSVPKNPEKPKPKRRDEPLELFTIDSDAEETFIFPSDAIVNTTLVPAFANISISDKPKNVIKPSVPVSAAFVETSSEFCFPNGIVISQETVEVSELPTKRVTPRRFDSLPSKVVIPPSVQAALKPALVKTKTDSKAEVAKENKIPEQKSEKADVLVAPRSPKKSPRKAVDSKLSESKATTGQLKNVGLIIVDSQLEVTPLNDNASQNGATTSRNQRKKAKKAKQGAAVASVVNSNSNSSSVPANDTVSSPMGHKQAKKVIAPLVASGSSSVTKAATNPKGKKQEKPKSNKEMLADLIDLDNRMPVFLTNGEGHYDRNDSPPVARKQQRGNNQKSVNAVVEDSPASPQAPPVVSRALTEDQALPHEILVPTVDDRRMPNIDNFSHGIMPFEPTNLQPVTGRFDQIQKLIKAREQGSK